MHQFRRVATPVLLALLTAAVTPAAAQPEGTYTPKGGAPKQPAGKDKPAPKQDKERLKQDGRDLFGKPDKNAVAKPAGSYWSIVIIAYREDDQTNQAQTALEKVRSEGGLKDAYLETRGAATVVAYGRYATEEDGKKDLARIRSLEVPMESAKGKPFASSFLAPPAEMKGTLPEYDLRNVRKQNPEALYTLQVGYYGLRHKSPTAAELAEFRKAAEQAVVQLRREGEEAYYCHGPKMSMVTVGVFAAEDFDSQTQSYSPALAKTRLRFPYNLFNGQGVRRTVTMTDQQTGKKIKKDAIEPSGLVLVPKE
jgi:hypothetical protein